MKKFISVFFAVYIIIGNCFLSAFADNLSYGASSLGLNLYCDYLSGNEYSKSVTIAIVDSGVANIDALKSMLIDGYDFVENDTDATNDTSSDSHGTTIASIISDITDTLPINIMPVRILEDKNIQIENLVSGIEFAVDNGADVINLSVGGTVTDCSSIDSAINYAYKNNVTVVVAAGNEKKEITNYCPAHNESAITVSSVDSNNEFAKRFSNYGDYVDCCAPGVNLVGYNALGMPKTVNGTSFSAAFISAGAAMMRLDHPEYSVDDIQEKIKSVCIDLGDEGFDKYYGYGLPIFSKLIKPSISIANCDKYDGKYIDYKSSITFAANVINMPEESEIYWFINDVFVAKGNKYTHKQAKEDFTVQAKLIKNNDTISESEIEQIFVKNSFLYKLIAYLKGLFGFLPVLIQSISS